MVSADLSGRSEEEVALVRESHAPPYETHHLSLSPWRHSDPEVTYLIVHHVRRSTPEEQAAWSKIKPSLPPEVEQLRGEWLAAVKSGDAELRAQLDEELEMLGHFRNSSFSAWSRPKAVEIGPGVFVQDERQNHR
jgi:hypothetical protein